MSINVFKKHPGNKITFSNRAILSGELKIMGYIGLRWYFVSMVPGSVECKTCCLLYVTFVSSLSSASSASSSTVLWCCSQRPWTVDGVARFNWMNIQNVSTSRLYNGCTTGCKVYTDFWRKLIPVPRTAAVVLQRTISLYSAGSGNSLARRAWPMHPRDAVLQPQQPTTGRSVIVLEFTTFRHRKPSTTATRDRVLYVRDKRPSR